MQDRLTLIFLEGAKYKSCRSSPCGYIDYILCFLTILHTLKLATGFYITRDTSQIDFGAGPLRYQYPFKFVEYSRH